MKPTNGHLGFLLLTLFATTLAHAQQGTIQHIIVVIQENRTPDNLFQDPKLITAGADIVPINTGGKCGTTSVSLRPRPLADCANPSHNHNTGWLPSYDKGNMDAACTIPVGYGTNCPPAYLCPPNSKNALDCTQYAYVSDPAIQPYWDIAEKYGYANYMFQTNQGPSFPAHQFLLSGSSAPVDFGHPLFTDFAAENTHNPNNSNSMHDAGCAATPGTTVKLVTTTQDESTAIYPCFEHPTLTDLLDQNSPSISWRYYGDQATSIWTAPNAISHICNNSVVGGGGGCGSGNGSNHDWNNDVKPYLETHNNLAPFLNDLKNCSLQQVTWVVPDGRWSDHPSENLGLGPDYVADIVNAIGGGMPGSTCNPPSNPIYWNNTVILIVWDDWGGWYDHVLPPDCQPGPNGTCSGYPGGNGNGQQYVYGFRVPLLVVSTYLKQTSQTYTGYISGTKATPINYDFGSILRFIENTFLPQNTFINHLYPYADEFIQPGINDLSDFFQCFTPACRNAFQPISLVSNHLCTQTQCGSNQCDATCFINYKGDHQDPDDE